MHGQPKLTRVSVTLSGLSEVFFECILKYEVLEGGSTGQLMRLVVPSQIVVVELNLKSQFNRRFWSNSKSNDGFELTIAIF